MKYVALLVIIIMFVRIDVLLGLFDKFAGNRESAPVDIETSDIKSKRETIPVAQDKNLQKTPRETFLALLEDFHNAPMMEVRERSMMIFKDHPTMFSQKLDQELESQIFRWRDFLNNNDPEAINFVLDLMNVLQGENLEMLKRFFSLWMEINMENFIAAYSRTRDTNCSVATIFGDAIPEDEKLNEYYDRQEALKTLLMKESIDPLHKKLAENCLLQLQIVIAKDPRSQTPEAPESEPAVGGVSP